MPKINREEYEVLKALDSRAKSIVRQARGWLWVAEQPIMKDKWSWFVADGFDEKLKGDNLFQFIQWEDDEPHNIAELIEEYESVETEVKKNKLWAKLKIREELESWWGVEGGIDEDGIKYVLNIIDQLDESEVLSKERIDKNVVHVRGLGDIIEAEVVEGLLVSNQEITYEDAIKVIAENIDTDEFSVGLYIEALNNNEKYEFLTEKWIEDNTSPVDDEGRLYVWKRDLQNVIVPKQELPVVIPKYEDD